MKLHFYFNIPKKKKGKKNTIQFKFSPLGCSITLLKKEDACTLIICIKFNYPKNYKHDLPTFYFTKKKCIYFQKSSSS